ncbi:hypothetical protein [Candidatus Enterococcus courvalinii]|uniref:Uncharacterized protein n=1 Tax=Candidatus Enterococcus courvalinii TaxID=2815329 RepID=A0ABS3I3F1_9ENTE|nr:hypothetical protein [Enterococcus sp. MSG2901]MBO0482326.1 hypothetical protein [Enterococcus sp. MSG2901]
MRNKFLTKIGLKRMFATPLMASAQGSYAEIEWIICSFEAFKKETGTKTPNLDQLRSLHMTTSKKLLSKEMDIFIPKSENNSIKTKQINKNWYKYPL